MDMVGYKGVSMNTISRAVVSPGTKRGSQDTYGTWIKIGDISESSRLCGSTCETASEQQTG